MTYLRFKEPSVLLSDRVHYLVTLRPPCGQLTVQQSLRLCHLSPDTSPTLNARYDMPLNTRHPHSIHDTTCHRHSIHVSDTQYMSPTLNTCQRHSIHVSDTQHTSATLNTRQFTIRLVTDTQYTSSPLNSQYDASLTLKTRHRHSIHNTTRH